MKTSTLLLWAALFATTDAFTVTPAARPTRISAARVPLRSAATADTKEEAGSVYEQLGITKDQLAMGVNPEDVLEWIGTKEAMVEKALSDISKFDRSKAEKEVDKYLMDPEMLNYHIEFKKALADNPNLIQPEEKEGFFSFRTLVGVYVTYVFGEIVYRKILHNFVNLDFIPGWGPPDAPAVEAVDAAASVSVDAIQSSLDVASSVVEAVGNSM